MSATVHSVCSFVSIFFFSSLVEILGQTQGDSGKELGLRPYPRELKEINPSLRDGQLYYLENGIPQKPYARVLIKRIK